MSWWRQMVRSRSSRQLLLAVLAFIAEALADRKKPKK